MHRIAVATLIACRALVDLLNRLSGRIQAAVLDGKDVYTGEVCCGLGVAGCYRQFRAGVARSSLYDNSTIRCDRKAQIVVLVGWRG